MKFKVEVDLDDNEGDDALFEEPEIKFCPACSVGVMLWDGVTYRCVDCGYIETDLAEVTT